MIILGLSIAIVWIAVGVVVAWHRSRKAYAIQIAQAVQITNIPVEQVKSQAVWRALVVFYGWTVAGLVGAILWLCLYVFLIVGHAEAEAKHRSKSRRKNSGGLVSLLLFMGLLSVTEDTLLHIERRADDLVVQLAILVTVLAALGGIIAID